MMPYIDIRDLISAFNKKDILSRLIKVVQLVLVQIIQVIWQWWVTQMIVLSYSILDLTLEIKYELKVEDIIIR